MKLFLLSDTQNFNKDLKSKLGDELKMAGNRIAYISSAKQTGDMIYYQTAIKEFQNINSDIEIDYFDLSPEVSDNELDKIKTYKIIYLSGGNTFTFLNDANNRKLHTRLRDFLNAGGVLLGASAGSIMMTPKIDIASLGDENLVELKDTTSFNFVNFEFHPHYIESDLQVLEQYKKTTGNKIYLCKDGDGIFYNNGEVILFGDIKSI